MDYKTKYTVKNAHLGRNWGSVINSGEKFHGTTYIETDAKSAEVDVETTIYKCGRGLRIFLFEGDSLRYTLHLKHGRGGWIPSHEGTDIDKDPGAMLAGQYIGDKWYSTPQEWVDYLVNVLIRIVTPASYPFELVVS